MHKSNNKTLLFRLLCAAAIGIMLSGCRGEEVDETQAVFPVTPNPGAFARFLNAAPAVPANGVADDEIHNVEDFPEAYYNTIDPEQTRDTFLKWRIANGFLNADGSPAACELPTCASTHVKFRDVKDLGYGRNMFMRWDKTTGDVAVYVENFQVDAIPGVPYGPLNFEALVNNDRQWNFGVNAIEFSAYPYTGEQARKYTKFYNFAGDGKRAILASGFKQDFVDLDGGGVKAMPTPCIVCHGGHGRTLVVNDTNGNKVLAPTVTDGLPGDLEAQMQIIELDTLQFSTVPGFTKADSEDGIRLINEAVLSTYEYRRLTTPPGQTGYWDSQFAIENINGRYNGSIGTEGAQYASDFIPSGWRNNPNAQAIYNTLVGPNCMVCHALRGSGLNNEIGFAEFEKFLAFADQIDHLTFERGVMPAGLLNYADFWEGTRNPALMAAAIGHPERINADNTAIKPGAAVAKLVAPLVATGLSAGQSIDIPLSAGGSAFALSGSYQWSVEPAAQAQIVETDASLGNAVLRASAVGNYTITLSIEGQHGGSDSSSQTIQVREQSATLPAADAITFFGDEGSDIYSWLQGNCTNCHIDNGSNPYIPIYYEPCNAVNLQGGAEQGFDFLYRSVLARVNFDAPYDSLILRKPVNGASDLSDRNNINNQIAGYHAGGLVAGSDEDVGRLTSWILAGAPRGDLPPASLIRADAPLCR